MSEAQTPSPELASGIGDAGDETANRYRFQWTWAAVVCCMLLDDIDDVVEVFCEHHEDVLLKHRDGSFTGHQVKTRSDDQPPWKAIDRSVLAACARFAKLETAFPERFRRFLFLTNHPLYSAGNGRDLIFVLQSIKFAATFDDLSAPIQSWVKRISRQANVSKAIAFAAMSKTDASADLPKLRDAVIRLIDTIAQCWPPATECSHQSVRQAAQALVEECSRASSLDHEQLLPAYVLAAVDTDEEQLARINGKRMTLARIQDVLERGRDSTAILAGDPALWAEPGEGSTELLHRKLDAGGFSAVSRNSAEDLRNKADYLGIRWTKQYGNTKGLARYDHVRTLVLADAGRAFDATQTVDHRFGPAMRGDLRRQFQSRRISGDQLFDCSDDHLEGFAFSLTAQCKVIWSLDRPWETE